MRFYSIDLDVSTRASSMIGIFDVDASRMNYKSHQLRFPNARRYVITPTKTIFHQLEFPHLDSIALLCCTLLSNLMIVFTKRPWSKSYVVA